MRQYDEKVFGALLEAKGFVQRFPTLNPSVDYTRILHRMVFREVHPWAGEIRQPGRLPPRVGGFVTCEAERLGTELKMLESQTTELLSKADRQGTLRIMRGTFPRPVSVFPRRETAPPRGICKFPRGGFQFSRSVIALPRSGMAIPRPDFANFRPDFAFLRPEIQFPGGFYGYLLG